MVEAKLTENAPRFRGEHRASKYRIIAAVSVAAALAIVVPTLFSGEFGELEVSDDRPTMSGSPELSWDRPEPVSGSAEPEARARFGTFEPVEFPNETDELLRDLAKTTGESGIVHLVNEDGSKKTLELTEDRWKVRP